MSNPPLFHEVVDAADALPPEEQRELIRILRKRELERDKRLLMAEVAEAREDYAAGRLSPQTVEEIMRDLKS